MKAAVVLLALMLVLGGGCRSLTGRSVGQWVDDKTLTARVKKRLAAEEASTLTRVHVDTYQGVVYLTGGVETPEMKKLAGQVVELESQVKMVVNNLHVVAEASAASPADAAAVAAPGAAAPVVVRGGALARLELEPGTPGWVRYAGYDAGGQRVATVFAVPSAQLGSQSVVGLVPALPVEHLSIYPDGPTSYVVFWHGVREAEAPEDAAR